MSAASPPSELASIFAALLRAPGGGIPAYSAGKAGALALQRRYVGTVDGAIDTDMVEAWDSPQVEKFWSELRLRRLSQSRVAILGVPSDTGAGIRKGAAYGPRALRTELLKLPDFQALVRADLVLDLGDLWVNPHLLHDEMLSSEQITRSREEMYPATDSDLRSRLPVSPLSQVEFLLAALRKEAPDLRIFAIGGDHSIAWPVTLEMAARHAKTLGIVQPDAHTDLLPSRLGVRYCFGTWSHHASDLLGQSGRLVQIGIRQSGRDRGHWEKADGVRQFWASEVKERGGDAVINDLVAHLKSKGVRQIYFSNDIDGTDESEASATGTPAPEGLSSAVVLNLIERLGQEFEVVAGDLMELAPDLGPTPADREKTCRLAARYAMATLQAMLRR